MIKSNTMFDDFITSLRVSDLEKILSDINGNDTFVVTLYGKEVNTPDQLFMKFGAVIGFPDFFGKNRDAFFDIMRDSHFMNKDLIVIIYDFGSLFSSSPQNKSIFTECLFDLLLCKLNIQRHIYVIQTY